MQATYNTLVVMDPQHPIDLILAKARQIADITHSHLHLLVCAKTNGHSDELHAVQDRLSQEGYGVTAEQAWHGTPCKTILTVQQAEGCSLVIKQHYKDGTLKKSLLTPEDWQLLRQSTSPVLMAKSTTPWAGGTILTAIDAGSDDVEHRLLQVGILSHGHDLAMRANASLHMMSAHPYPMLSARDPMFQLKEEIQHFYQEQCRSYQDEFEISDEHLHIEEGPAEVLIPGIAHRLGAALTILGSVGRSGLSGALIGNTAETVLDTLESDVLVLKPNDVIHDLEELTTHH
ncbi:universal stress protein UspA [Pseudomonas sp. R-28-1W-6]|uniref:universal stress protein n=1 Tax=Pseudomonas sp. R-28-1W-6 TaxID=2650101 RepID=UPI0013652E2C|nr:universal stress protein [Pseudomonas sp. R-28-1W-6]MWV12392.1 universal stress protein UspA [Pseudomonas sp. R-28-1W-6]